MKKSVVVILLALLSLTVSSFAYHKFYVGLFQVNFVPEKKMLQVTARLFVDDLNLALGKKYNKKVYLGDHKETTEDVVLLKKYLNEKFNIKINNQSKPFFFVTKELEGDVLVCYLRLNEVKKISQLEVFNSLLMESSSEQQNIMHFNIKGTKNTLLLTNSSARGMLKY